MSVRTRWQDNVRAYQRLAALPMPFSKEELAIAVREANVGLWRNRTEGVWRFHSEFWADPSRWYPQDGEGLRACRERLSGLTYGIRQAKVSFALEMAFPFNREVVCLDTRVLGWYGIPNDARGRQEDRYRSIEAHWCATCDNLGVPPVIGRHIIWDQASGEPSTRYWSFVFEDSSHAGQGEHQAGG